MFESTTWLPHVLSAMVAGQFQVREAHIPGAVLSFPRLTPGAGVLWRPGRLPPVLWLLPHQPPYLSDREHTKFTLRRSPAFAPPPA